ncbi:hypothetical protein F4X33_00005 [Candidatus Poribacteria bacterium]|nr:hypothetical protein [Candidatus Poribacteria bacterium]
MPPKPVVVAAAAFDYFPIQGSIEAVDRAKRIYSLYGAEDKVDIAIGPTRHEYSPPLREACVNWYKRHFRGESPDFRTAEPEILPDEALWATPNGQVLDLHPNSRTVFDLNRELLEVSPVFQFAGNGNPDQMRETVAEVLGIPEGRDGKIYPRIVAENVVDGYQTEEIFFFSEPNIVVTGTFIHPLEGTAIEQTDLIVFENGTNDNPDKREWLEARLASGRQLFVFDPRGIGGVQVRSFNRDVHPHDGEFKLASDAMMLGISTMGLRVFDILRGYDYLRTRADVNQIGLYGVGKSALYAYFAGALENGFASFEFEDLLYSYRDLTDTHYYDQERYDLEVMAWGILKHFDLVDLTACFGDRPVRWIAPRNAKGEILPDAIFDQEVLAVARDRGYLGKGTKA